MIAAARSWIAQHRIVSFLLITYAFTWSIQAVLAATDMEASWTLSILVGFGAFGPPIGAAVVLWASGGDLRSWISQLFMWRIGVRWWVLALGLPIAILAAGSALYALFGGPVDVGSLPFVGIYVFAMAWGIIWGGGQEELGWRGFMLPVLQARYSALTSSLVVGIAWAGWHLPLFLNANTTHGGWPLSQQLIWIVTILAGSVLWTWMYNSTGGSVLAVAVFHAGINTMGIFHPADRDALAPGGVPDPWLNLLAEATTGVVLVAIAVGLVLVWGSSHLSPRRRPGLEAVSLAGSRESRARTHDDANRDRGSDRGDSR
ncbi:CPBP family intramembrane glutamic endopeptidase [Natronosalvus rutilus]|uniref:CPBP family intramembrane metalloprotease n=1 Tax=Natronosalvus rutilus TaxID=2953753 RepID=A0A9E7N7U2_9EURY|nr:type II CAAX endopeptidase family protein [Natronosalvus rutilus]UTF52491.1 CPBP family intramembrane metalloprotease [Natronosalvus rutilus]